MTYLNVAIRRIAGAGLMLCSAAASAEIQQDKNTVETITDKVESLLGKHVAGNFSGAILIAQNGELLHAQGYGFAKREEEIPNALNTVFETGSLARYFTATAVLKLVEQNKLSLDDTLGEIFDAVPEGKQNITIHHLLTHTAGLFGDEELDAFKVADKKTFLKDVFSKDNSVSPAVFLPTFTFHPGERAIAFSEGYSLLALIVERQSGMPFDVFLHDHLLEPAGMTNTGYPNANWNDAQVANGYIGEEYENWGNLPERLSEEDSLPYLKGSMGLLSTVNDLYTWHRALHGGKVLREDLVKLLHTRHIGSNDSDEADADYGYGIKLSESWTGTPWIHNAQSDIIRRNLPAFSAQYNYFPEEDTLIIIASNGHLGSSFSDTVKTLVRVLLEPDYSALASNASEQN